MRTVTGCCFRSPPACSMKWWIMLHNEIYLWGNWEKLNFPLCSLKRNRQLKTAVYCLIMGCDNQNSMREIFSSFVFEVHGLHLRRAFRQTPTCGLLPRCGISCAPVSSIIKQWGVPSLLLACFFFFSQSATKETTGHWQDSDELSWRHQMQHLAVMLLFVCQELSKTDMSTSREQPG